MLKNRATQAMVGDGIDFGKVNARLARREGSRSRDGKLTVVEVRRQVQRRRASRRLLDDARAGIRRLDGHRLPALQGLRRARASASPRRYAAIRPPAPSSARDGLFHIKLSGTFKDDEAAGNEECGRTQVTDADGLTPAAGHHPSRARTDGVARDHPPTPTRRRPARHRRRAASADPQRRDRQADRAASRRAPRDRGDRPVDAGSRRPRLLRPRLKDRPSPGAAVPEPARARAVTRLLRPSPTHSSPSSPNLLLPDRHALLEAIDHRAARGERLGAMRCGRRRSRPRCRRSRACRRGARPRAARPAISASISSHSCVITLIGHRRVGLVLEVIDRRAVAVARTMPVNVTMPPMPGPAHRGDAAIERQRLGESARRGARAAGDRRDQRELVAVGERVRRRRRSPG